MILNSDQKLILKIQILVENNYRWITQGVFVLQKLLVAFSLSTFKGKVQLYISHGLHIQKRQSNDTVSLTIFRDRPLW